MKVKKGLEAVRVVREKLPVKRVLAVSDIHGNYDLFRKLLKKMEYRVGEDALIIDGDLIEKGTQNLKVLHFAMELKKQRNVFVLQGNCDLMGRSEERLFQYLNWFGERTLFGEMAKEQNIPLPKRQEDIPSLWKTLEAAYPEEFAFLRGLPHILETERFLFAHAGLRDENIEAQELDYVLSTPLFGQQEGDAFHKLLITGHYPTANYRENILDNSPFYNEARNVLSIDGGNVVKTLGQLNGVILDNETGSWNWECAVSFPPIAAPCSQAAAPGTAVIWPENQVEILERGQEFCRCKITRTGEILEVPSEYLYEREDGLHCDDITSCRLAVKEGETVSLIREYSDRLLILKEGRIGFLFKDGSMKKECR